MKMSDEACYFSIIVPVFNTEKYLCTCLDSILTQTFTDYEVLLINDGSTDNSASICKQYAERNQKIRVIEQENKGLLQARRTGLRSAQGKYIVHIDSDDSCKSTLLETIYNYIQEHDADMVVFNYDLIDDDGKFIKTVKASISDSKLSVFELDNKNVFVKAFVEGHDLNSIWMKCAKREIYDIEVDYEKYGRLSMGEDALQTMPLIENAQKILCIDESLYLYRFNPQGMSRKIKKDYIFDYIYIQKRGREMLKNLNMNFLEEVSETRYIHRIAAQLLQIMVVCDSKKEYCSIYNQVQKKMEINIKSYWKKLTVFDKIGCVLRKPYMYNFSKRISKLYFDNK